MKQRWTVEELDEQWRLNEQERQLVGNKTGPTRLAFSEAGEAVPVAMMDGSAWLVAVLRCCTSPGEQVASPRDELLDGLRGSAGDFLDRGGHAVIPILAM